MTYRRAFLVVFIVSLLPLQRVWSEEGVSAPVATLSVEEVAVDPVLLEARQALDAGQWKKARKTLKTYLRANKKSAEGWTLLARTYQSAGSTGKAMRRFNKALTFDPHYAPAFLGRGELFEKKGRLDEAANDFRAATIADPSFPEAGQALARVNPPVSQRDSNPVN